MILDLYSWCCCMYVCTQVADGPRDEGDQEADWAAWRHMISGRYRMDTAGSKRTMAALDADKKGLATIAGEVKQLALRVKDKSLKPEDYEPLSRGYLGIVITVWLNDGTNTWNRFEIWVHKRVIDLVSFLDVAKHIIMERVM
ncbi:unnamed protein product [Triticum turgidum subsp. durum]|uniref:Uncharacterized protein n=1 Tax=Triticum turgidum subsp. durum TaxID=4567 RepID=A0A9R1R0N2_TRITD|nr:unnamed protein product [Triticum turgidum subsp. durum]